MEWDQVPGYMHLESCLEPQKDMGPDGIAGLAGAAARKGQAPNGRNDEPESDREWIGTEEVDAILERTFTPTGGVILPGLNPGGRTGRNTGELSQRSCGEDL